MSTIHLKFTYKASDFISALYSLPLGVSQLWITPAMGLLALLASVLLQNSLFAIIGGALIVMAVFDPFLIGYRMSRCPT